MVGFNLSLLVMASTAEAQTRFGVVNVACRNWKYRTGAFTRYRFGRQTENPIHKHEEAEMDALLL
jgi:hypothetical protein